MSWLRHLGWDQCSHGLSCTPSASCHHQCLQAVCPAAEHLDGTLKLHSCTTVFTKRFSPWSLPGEGGRVSKRESAAHLSNDSSCTVKLVRLTRKTYPRIPVHERPHPGLPTPKRWERLAPLTPQELAQSFSSPWGWLSSPLGTLATCTRRQQAQGFFPAGQSSRRDLCTGTARGLISLHACA